MADERCKVTRHDDNCTCGKDDEDVLLEDTIAAITSGPSGLCAVKLAKFLIRLEDSIDERIEPLEAHKEAADDAAEAATHAPDCKCGLYNHW